MNMSVLIYNYVRKRKKSARYDKLAKRLVFNFMECNINLRKCKLVLNALMTIITSFNDTELKRNVSMKFYKDNTRLKKKKQRSS